MAREDNFEIKSFSSGVNEYIAEGLLQPNEATNAVNCDISDGSLKTVNKVSLYHEYPQHADVISIMPFYSNTGLRVLAQQGNHIYHDNNIVSILNFDKFDYLNFMHKSKESVIITSKSNNPSIYSGTGSFTALKNRWIRYKEDGTIDKYIDANGVEHDNENTITTYAPQGSFIELYYDRLWVSGNSENKDRIYFSTAGINGADIEDWTYPIDEAEANQHGGFLDVRSYDGSSIIGLKAMLNTIVVFKSKSAYKIFGNSPDNFQMVELFNCNGAIADKSICVGNNGAYFLNEDGIYFYDGTNTNLISQKISKTIKNMNTNYSNKSVAVYHDNNYYIAIPTGDSSLNNTLIQFNTQTNSFMIYNISHNIFDMVVMEGNIYISTWRNIYILNGDKSDTMYMCWETPYFDFGEKNSRKNTSYIYFRGKGNGNVKFTLVSDKKTKELIVPLSNDERIYRKKLKNKGRWFKLKIENVDTSSIEITSPQIVTEIDVD